jgi:hypothetical protein
MENTQGGVGFGRVILRRHWGRLEREEGANERQRDEERDDSSGTASGARLHHVRTPLS